MCGDNEGHLIMNTHKNANVVEMSQNEDEIIIWGDYPINSERWFLLQLQVTSLHRKRIWINFITCPTYSNKSISFESDDFISRFRIGEGMKGNLGGIFVWMGNYSYALNYSNWINYHKWFINRNQNKSNHNLRGLLDSDLNSKTMAEEEQNSEENEENEDDEDGLDRSQIIVIVVSIVLVLCIFIAVACIMYWRNNLREDGATPIELDTPKKESNSPSESLSSSTNPKSKSQRRRKRKKKSKLDKFYLKEIREFHTSERLNQDTPRNSKSEENMNSPDIVKAFQFESSKKSKSIIQEKSSKIFDPTAVIEQKNLKTSPRKRIRKTKPKRRARSTNDYLIRKRTKRSKIVSPSEQKLSRRFKSHHKSIGPELYSPAGLPQVITKLPSIKESELEEQFNEEDEEFNEKLKLIKAMFPSAKLKSKDVKYTCFLCQGDMREEQCYRRLNINCDHQFHQLCFDTYLRDTMKIGDFYEKQCPICRKFIFKRKPINFG